jgi:hypothetical protein
VQVAPKTRAKVPVPSGSRIGLRTTHAESGTEVEAFSESLETLGGTYVYNVAAAAPLRESTAVRAGNMATWRETAWHNQRFFVANQTYVLEPPPHTISRDGNLLYLRDPELSPGALFQQAGLTQAEKGPLAALHVRWDSPSSDDYFGWAGEHGFCEPALARLRVEPNPAILEHLCVWRLARAQLRPPAVPNLPT